MAPSAAQVDGSQFRFKSRFYSSVSETEIYWEGMRRLQAGEVSLIGDFSEKEIVDILAFAAESGLSMEFLAEIKHMQERPINVVRLTSVTPEAGFNIHLRELVIKKNVISLKRSWKERRSR